MIIILDINIIISNPGELKKYSPEVICKIRKNESVKNVEFVLPEKLSQNKDRKIYKTGFLFNFLDELYPKKTYDDICEIMTLRYHVFLEKRQVQRSSLLFNSNEFYIN